MDVKLPGTGPAEAGRGVLTGWRERRLAIGVSLREVARKAGIAPSYLSLIERERMCANAAQAEALLVALRDASLDKVERLLGDR
jgi:predicted transcriptional regulator